MNVGHLSHILHIVHDYCRTFMSDVLSSDIRVKTLHMSECMKDFSKTL